MASVIKNPLILNSANYIYNYFIGINSNNDGLIKNSNILEAIESDEDILKRLNKNQEEKYQDITGRLNTAREKMNGR